VLSPPLGGVSKRPVITGVFVLLRQIGLSEGARRSKSVSQNGVRVGRTVHCLTTLEWLNRGRVLDDKIYRLQKEYLNVHYELFEAISKLPDRQDRIILIDYYCSGLTWAMIAESLGVNYKTIDRMKNKALQHLEEAIKHGEITTEKRR